MDKDCSRDLWDLILAEMFHVEHSTRYGVDLRRWIKVLGYYDQINLMMLDQ